MPTLNPLPWLAASVLICACTSQPRSPAASAPAVAGESTPIVIGQSWTIESEALGQTRNYNVWLPPSYSKGSRSYPVLYVIDGGLEQDFQHISGLAQLGCVAAMFDELIVVGVETVDRRAELTFPTRELAAMRQYPTQGKCAFFRRYLIDELKPVVDARYRTSGEDALIGESLAGLFIVDTFVEAPDAFDDYFAISPSLWWDFGSLGKRAGAALNKLPSGQRQLYLTIANEGGRMRDALLELVGALNREPVADLRWKFSDRPDLEHSTIYHREALEALVWAFPPESK